MAHLAHISAFQANTRILIPAFVFNEIHHFLRIKRFGTKIAWTREQIIELKSIFYGKSIRH
jgi:hypothetical protein